MDTHVSSCTLGVMTPGGKRVGSHVVETLFIGSESLIVDLVEYLGLRYDHFIFTRDLPPSNHHDPDCEMVITVRRRSVQLK